MRGVIDDVAQTNTKHEHVASGTYCCALLVSVRATDKQVYANPDDGLSLLVGWNAPTDTNGAEILAYVVELAPSSLGWSEPYLNVTVTAEDAAETATSVTIGGTLIFMAGCFVGNFTD